MKLKKGEILKFEEILVKVKQVNDDVVIFEVLSSGYEGDKGNLMEVPMWYLKENINQLKR